jgi:hypothetical protein
MKSTYLERIKIGDKYGDWEVLEIPFPKKKQKQFKTKKDKGKISYEINIFYVKCRCKCGKIVDVNCYNLLNKSKSCYECSVINKKGDKNPNWKGIEEIPGSWIRKFQRKGKKEFKITKEYIYDLWNKQNKKCALTNLPIDFKNEKNSRWLMCSASLDRIDSSKGYIEGNVQLVHKNVNIMKNDFSQDYFIEMCKLVSKV